MLLRLTSAKYLGGHRLWLQFNDGREGEVDLTHQLTGPIFTPLQDENYFARVSLEGPTVAWPNGADLAPEYLADLL